MYVKVELTEIGLDGMDYHGLYFLKTTLVQLILNELALSTSVQGPQKRFRFLFVCQNYCLAIMLVFVVGSASSRYL
jgi:hypothetical protein